MAWGSKNEIGEAISVTEDATQLSISERLGGQHKARNFYNSILARQ